MATVWVTPNPAAPNAPATVTGAFFPSRKAVRVVYNGATSPTIRCSRSGSFNYDVVAGPVTAPLVVMAYTNHQWGVWTRSELVVQAVAVPPPPPPPPPGPTTGIALTYLATPNVPAPAVGAFITDVFGNDVWNICEQQRHAYALGQWWNVGTGPASRILLSFTTGSAHIHLGVPPYTHLKTMQVPNGAMWSQTDPNILIGYQGNALVWMDINVGAFADAAHALHDFGAPVTIGQYEGRISDDGNRVALDAGGQMMVWDIAAKRAIATWPLPNCDGYQISRSGRYVVIRGGNTRVLDSQNPTAPPRIIDALANHGSVCTINGEDWYVGNNATALIGGSLKAVGVAAFRLSDGQMKVLLPYRNAFADGHANGHGPKPVVSVYDSTVNDGQPGRDFIAALNFDGTIEPFGWSHHLTPDTYGTEPMASMDRSGKRALFFGWDKAACVVERP